MAWRVDAIRITGFEASGVSVLRIAAERHRLLPQALRARVFVHDVTFLALLGSRTENLMALG